MTKLTPYQDKALNYNQHISVTANAGSGKTFVLSKRYLNILLKEEIAIKNIVAITFTEKAASELYRKIAGEIEEALLKSTDPIEVRKLEILRRQLVSANISTIHSFCINVLKEFSPEAGIDAAFIPIDQITSNELIDLSIENLFESLVNVNELTDILKNVIRIFASKGAVVNILKNMVNNRKIVNELADSIYSRPSEEISKSFTKMFEDEATEIFGNSIGEITQQLKYINKQVLNNAKNIDLANKVTDELELLITSKSVTNKILILNNIKKIIFTTNGKSIRSRDYITSKLREDITDVIDEIEAFYEAIKMFDIQENYEQSHNILADVGLKIIELYKTVLKEYENKKYSKAYLDFEDILLYTEKLLISDEVIKSLSEKYNYIMIDEFQDTNELQYNIFMPILKNLSVGNLFIVGDQKQSIYRFRGAEPEIFEQTRNEIKIKSEADADLELPHSFRVAPSIAAFVNLVFSELLKSPNKKFNEIEYNNLVCARDENDFGEIKFLFAEKNNDDIDEKELIAREILQLNNKGIPIGNIAVLCRKRKSFLELEEVFIKHGIPFIIAGGKGFYQRQIISDIYNYISFLLNPKDDIALVGILRAPFYTLSDSEIFEISLDEGATFFDKLKKQKGNYYTIILDLEKHLKMAARIEFPQLIRNILGDTQYWSSIAARRDAEQELANIEKIIVIASTFANQGFKTLFDFKEYLAKSIDTLSDEGQAITGADENCVKVMTIHQSKGLEFDTLFLYRCGDIAMDDKVKSGSLAVDKEFGLMTKIYDDNTFFEKTVLPPLTALHNFFVIKKDQAELKRLLYVAITRAVNRLYICATAKDDKFTSGSFISLIQKGLRNDLFETYKNQYSQMFMKGGEENFEVYNSFVNLSIPVITNLDITESDFHRKNDQLKNPKFNTNQINDLEKEEIISATKIATFTQCPVKYELTYELGYSKFLNLLDNKIDMYVKDYRAESDEGIELAGDVRGRIIHTILENKVEREELSSKVKNLLLSENYLSNKNKNILDQIVNDLEGFYNSKLYNEINQYDTYYNEFEIYTKHNDYYLFGIVDKLIVENDKLIIIDYKSDQINEEKIKERAENYLPQLKFYCYALSKHFNEIKNFEMKLIFVSLPEKSIEMNIDKKEIDEYGNYIQSVVNNIRKFSFSPNLTHCNKCHFYKGNTCLKNIQ